MYINNNTDKKKLIAITEEFLNFLSKLYKEGAITYEQYNKMALIKKEFLKHNRLEE